MIAAIQVEDLRYSYGDAEAVKGISFEVAPGEIRSGALQEELFARVNALPGVVSGASHISVPGARAFTLPSGRGRDEAYLVRRFASSPICTRSTTALST